MLIWGRSKEALQRWNQRSNSRTLDTKETEILLKAALKRMASRPWSWIRGVSGPRASARVSREEVALMRDVHRRAGRHRNKGKCIDVMIGGAQSAAQNSMRRKIYRSD